MRRYLRWNVDRMSLVAFLPALTLSPVSPVPEVAVADEAPAVREVGQLVLDGIPEFPERIVERSNQYGNTRRAGFADWAPDGGIIVRTRFGETSQIHHLEAPGSARQQLTFFHEPTGGGSFGKATDWFLFTKDFGGNEAVQIFRFDLTGGQATLLTDGESQNGVPIWSNSRERIAWRSTARNKTDHDIWVMSPEDESTKQLVLQTEGYWAPLDWSPDDSRLLVQHYVSINETYPWWLDLESGEKKPVGRHEPVDGVTIAYGGAVFDATGAGVFFTSDEGTEHRTLRWMKLESGEVEEITGGISWSVNELVISRDRKTVAFTVNEDGSDKLYLMEAKSRKYRPVDLPLGLVESLRFSDDGKRLGFTFSSPASPEDAYSLDVKSGKVHRWTHSEVGGLDTSKFVMSEIIHYPTFDQDENGEQRMIPAFLYVPEGEGPFPVIVRIHGGPESQARAWFSYTSQYYTNELGCAVIYPNVRGSSGYGKTYVKLDNGFKREDSVKDIGALLDWIAKRPDLDETRIGITGGSYGGYMTFATLTNYGTRVRCGVASVGISNFVTFLNNTKDYRRDLRRAEYGDERDDAMRKHLEKISPTNNADKISVPLMVIQGANDPRVPASEAEQIVAAVRENGNHAWYMLGKDEGHGFRKKSNRDQMIYGLSLFWETYLTPKEPRMKVEQPEEVPGASR